MTAEKCVLAYSGGMDSTISIGWIKEHYGLDVIAVSVELGSGADAEALKQRALRAGALDVQVHDIRSEFVQEYVWRGLKAGALYEEQYALSTALARPLMAKKLVEVARSSGAVAIAHGCTGKGNDQVRFDAAIKTLSSVGQPLRVVAPAREWEMTRDEEKEYADKAGINLQEVGSDRRVYSLDSNLWGQAIEGEDLEDTWSAPQEDAYTWTVAPEAAPDAAQEIAIQFEKGVPVALDGRRMDGVALIQHLNETAGRHGVGRIDHVENRLVGIKSREVYETPAAAVLFAALGALEALTLSREQARLKRTASGIYADLVYDGRWFTALRENLDALMDSMHAWTSGEVRVRLLKGAVQVVGRRSDYSLYDFGLATYSTEDEFQHSSATGFIDIHSLPARIQYRNQTMRDAR